MTVAEAIAAADALRPNANSAAQKTAWLSLVEAAVFSEIILSRAHADDLAFGGYAPDASPSPVLLVPDPYSDLYVQYLVSRIDCAAGEAARYNASSALFNAAYQSFAAHYTRTTAPKEDGGLAL